MRKIISLICFLLPVLAFAGQSANPPQIRSDAPDQYIVVKGDTLWGIAGKFFNDPWRWPYIWGMNKDGIKDPHWIYPGATIVLDRVHGTLRMGGTASIGSGAVVKLSPQMISEATTQNAIASIPAKEIEPFLSQPLVVDDAQLATGPTLIGMPEERVVAGTGDVIYAKGLTQDKGNGWQIYRSGKVFVDPDTQEVLGHEAIYLGSATVRQLGDISTLVVTSAKQEISKGDRLVAADEQITPNYLPRAPETNISARVISIYGGVSQGGHNTVVTLNKGMRDGIQRGHVLALFSKGLPIKDEGKLLALPDERYGLLFVFRVFDKVSYGLVMQAHMPVQLLDRASTP